MGQIFQQWDAPLMQSSSLSLASIANQTEDICVPRPDDSALFPFRTTLRTSLCNSRADLQGVLFGHSQWPSQIWKGSCKKPCPPSVTGRILFVFSADVCKYLSRKQRQKVSGTKVDWSTVQIWLFVREFFWRWFIINGNNSTLMGTLDVFLRLSYFLWLRILMYK